MGLTPYGAAHKYAAATIGDSKMASLREIADPGFLRRIHKEIRDRMRDNHLTSALLLRDPLLLAPTDYELGKVLRIVGMRILDGTYRPKPPHMVQIAKSAGLRRPVTYLQHDDALVLRALCYAAQGKLFDDFPEWVSFGREDTKEPAVKKRKAKRTKATAFNLDYEGCFT